MAAFKTPKIPTWIKRLDALNYTNVFDLKLRNRNLFGTETLCGDWDGELLIVAKDFAPLSEVCALKKQKIPATKIFRHNDGDQRYKTGFKTNKKLVELLQQAGYHVCLDGAGNTNCKVLYISACFFLKNQVGASSSLQRWYPGTDVFEGSVSILRFVYENMPKLRGVACLGNEAEKLVRYVGRSKELSRMIICKHRHPSRGSNAEHIKSWSRMMRRIRSLRKGQ